MLLVKGQNSTDYYINGKEVVLIEPLGSGCKIRLKGGISVDCASSPEKVAEAVHVEAIRNGYHEVHKVK